MGRKANGALKEPSFIQQFLVIPSVVLTHSITSHVLPPDSEFPFPLNLQNQNKTRTGFMGTACSCAGPILNTCPSASGMQQEHLPEHPALSSHPLALCVCEVSIVLPEKGRKKILL